ncbi:2-isopropylmalate synthase [Moniliophthora roreri MCA 2997]|uniref:2-isopropylmalate synthase n=2 Tax=Moniliophthora roreri TaxID=221103 RepID=V2WXJ9_MONRO|nr:2-isopropylmalate synthase [Moniliophthora roreri MCA 2997]KAI3610568.1 2-isopropylmalate synthase [Moniliophthora roreri]
MPMLTDPSTKYLPYVDIPFPAGYVRKWPTKRTTEAPLWLSTDLRDGNQALVNPMSNATKLELFRLLVKIGFKEIEVAYPSASELEFQFVRTLIEKGEIPPDVAVQVITPAREDLVAKSVASLAGVRHGIIHLYNAVSPVFREVVFRNTKEQTIDLTLNAVRLVKKLTEEETARSGAKFTLNYCLETFSQTEPEFAVELANKVLAEWGKATPEDKIYFNVAATVECAPSNHYADLVEYFSTNINQRDATVISIHPHNDRGTAVAAAELGLLAGGDRIEGCLLGNGERTGNVDLITLALNLYSQGISPRLDFSNLPEIVQTVCRCNESAVPVRYPYAGTLVFSAFAGTHQDAIKKGLDAQENRWADVDRTGKGTKYWAMPYIPLDPKDLGYGYENLIRVSSQSGKAGTAYVVKQTLRLDIPRRMQVAFYGVVQSECEKSGKEMTTALITQTFKRTYALSSKPMGRVFLQSAQFTPMSPSSLSDASDDSERGSLMRFDGQVLCDGRPRSITGDGKDVIEAVLDALQSDLDFELCVGEAVYQTLSADNMPEPKTATYLELLLPGSKPSKSGAGSVWGVGVSSDKTTSKARAVVSAANGLIGNRQLPRAKMVYTPRRDMSVPRSESWIRDVKMRTGHVVPHTPDKDMVFQLEASK